MIAGLHCSMDIRMLFVCVRVAPGGLAMLYLYVLCVEYVQKTKNNNTLSNAMSCLIERMAKLISTAHSQPTRSFMCILKIIDTVYILFLLLLRFVLSLTHKANALSPEEPRPSTKEPKRLTTWRAELMPTSAVTDACTEASVSIKPAAQVKSQRLQCGNVGVVVQISIPGLHGQIEQCFFGKPHLTSGFFFSRCERGNRPCSCNPSKAGFIWTSESGRRPKDQHLASRLQELENHR